MTNLDQLAATPVSASGTGVTSGPSGPPQLFANLATTARRTVPAIVNHYNIQPAFDVYAQPDGRDLGGVAHDVDRLIDAIRPKLPRGSTITLRGQVQNMRQSFDGLIGGIFAALILVFIILMINFQTFLDPVVIVAALPGAVSGVLWALFITRTTFSVPSLMGMIMAIGVATSNSVLLITFADDARRAGFNARDAAIEAGRTRLRPVIMTALAMIIGMIPMALALAEGGEENAPLGRAVIGGLLVASVYTLVVVPVFYAVIRQTEPMAEIVLPDATPIEQQFAGHAPHG
jgi:multidrug efflux pump subunit AcrB